MSAPAWSASKAREALRRELSKRLRDGGEGTPVVQRLRMALEQSSLVCDQPRSFAVFCDGVLGDELGVRL